MDLFKSDAFSEQVRELMSRHHVPGLAIAIVQDGEVVSTGYGYACLETSAPCTGSTLFDIASSSKSLTAAAVGILVADNDKYPEVQYEATMSSLLPDDFVMPGVGYTEGVTVEDVLSHRTGMASHDSSCMGICAAKPDDARSVTRNLRNLPVAAPIRSRYLYCNMMYTVATYLIEVKTQQSFSDFLEERIFRPLDMTSTNLQSTRAGAKGLGDRIATGYYWDGDSSAYCPIQPWDCPEGQGAGSVVTSADDFIKWVKCLLRREGPINEKVYQGLIRMRSFVNPSGRRLKRFTSPTFYAAGLEIYYYRGHMVVGHDGAIPGFGSRFLFLPDSKFGVVVMGNSDGIGTVSNIVCRQLIDSLLGVPNRDVQPRNRNKKQKVPKTAPRESLTLRQKSASSNRGQNLAKNEGKPAEKPETKELQTRKPELREASSPQEIPLTAYAGTYSHPGYRTMVVQIRDEKLFIDATDRSMGFTLEFEHVADQTKYTAYLSDLFEGGRDPVRAEFLLTGGRATKMGLDLEPVLKELIWFEFIKDT